MSRVPTIKRVSESGYETINREEGPAWLKDVAASQESGKTIVQITRERQKAMGSFLNSLQRILTKKPVYATVEDAVNDMRERTGLNSYLSSIADNKNPALKIKADHIIKTVQEESEKTIPECLKQHGDIADRVEQFLVEKISLRRGNVKIPALKEELVQLFNIPKEDIENDEVSEYISNLISASAQADVEHDDPRHLARLGDDVDRHENDKYFAILDPAK